MIRGKVIVSLHFELYNKFLLLLQKPNQTLSCLSFLGFSFQTNKQTRSRNKIILKIWLAIKFKFRFLFPF